MRNSIVRTLERWLSENSSYLLSKDIKITDRIPNPDADVPWKGSIGLSKGSLIISFTVWERIHFQSELIVVDVQTGEPVLNEAVKKLINGTFNA